MNLVVGVPLDRPELVEISRSRVLILVPERTAPDRFRFAADNTPIAPVSVRVHGPHAARGQNVLANADFAQSELPWRLVEEAAAENVSLGRDIAEPWYLAGGHTAFLRVKEPSAKTAIEYAGEDGSAMLPVTPDARYVFSGLFGLHRCFGSVCIDFLDEACAPLESHLHEIGEAIGGKAREDYAGLSLELTPAAGARYARVRLIAEPTRADAYVFFTDLFFGLSGQATRQGDWARIHPKQALSLGLGGHLLEFELPSPVRAEWRELEIYDHDSAAPLPGSPFLFPKQTGLKFVAKGFDGFVLSGRLICRSATPGVHNIEIVIDGKLADALSVELAETLLEKEIAVRLPNAWLDGNVHTIALRHAASGETLYLSAELLRSVATPWEALQRHSRMLLPEMLSPLAKYRYKSLALHADRLATNPNDARAAVILPQLSHCHEVLQTGFERKRDYKPLRFPAADRPDVSVVIPVHDRFAVTYSCLAALLLAYNNCSFEVIVVDDGSSDETRDLADLVEGITIAQCESSNGFAVACNQGASLARGRFIAFLNNDTEPAPFWLDELLGAFSLFDSVGLAGAKLVYPDGRLQEAGSIIFDNGKPWNYGRNGNAEDPKYNYARQADYLSGAAIMLPADVWSKVGGFSKEFAPAYFEDTDLAFKVRSLGLKTVYMPQSVVCHYEGATGGTDVDSGAKRFQNTNFPRFKRKWAEAYRQNGSEEADIDVVKDRNVFARALVIDAQTPRPDNDAGSYAAIQEIRLLQALGYKVSFVPLNLAHMGTYTKSLQRIGVEVLYAPFVTSIEELLAARGREFDLVYLTRYYVAKAVMPHARRHCPRAKILFNDADLHFLRELRHALGSGESGALAQVVETREAELAVMRDADLTLSYSETEHAVILSHNLDKSKVAKAPWVIEAEPMIAEFRARQDIGFLGGFGHPPNREAVEYFCANVMPSLRERLAGVKFLIFGSDMPPELDAVAGDDVIARGYVEELTEVYARCRVFVAPLVSGAGIKGKVLASLAYGLPTVLSPVAAEGTGLRSGLDCLIAETPAEWVEHIATLYADPARWEQISSNGRAYVSEAYSFERGLRYMRTALEQVGVFMPATASALYATTANPPLRDGVVPIKQAGGGPRAALPSLEAARAASSRRRNRPAAE